MKIILDRSIKKIALILAFFMINTVNASTYNIGSGSGGFTNITTLLQSWVNFMVGPYGKAVVAGSIIIGVTAWAVMPKEGILGYAIRGAVAGAVVFNIVTWMGMFG